MVVAQKMQDAVDQQEHKLFIEADIVLPGLPGCGLQGDNHVPQKLGLYLGKGGIPHGKGDDVGGAVVAEIVPVQLLYLVVIQQQYAYFWIF